MKACHLCRQERCAELLHFGNQPICHRFVEGDEQEEKYPLVLGQCEACGLVQLMDPMPVEKLTPRYDWVKYKEPEAHLESMAQRITSLPGISPESRILGVCEHEVPLLNHMWALGFRRTEMINPVHDLGLKRTKIGVEVIQSYLDHTVAGAIARQRGFSDIVIARRILEHSYNLVEFLKALRSLVRPKGYVVIEVPDCQQALEQIDVGVIWEEHILYFTPETFRECFAFSGLELQPKAFGVGEASEQFEIFPYPQENCLVAIAESPLRASVNSRPADTSPAFLGDWLLKQERNRATAFASGLVQLQEALHQYLSDYRNQHGKIAFFGAGHRSCTYINLLELKDFIEFVVDDDANKQNLKMPGSRLPIRGSKALLKDKIKLCLLGINPESEAKVIQNNQDFLEHGGAFSSIYPNSKYALQI